jgi:hypothetical protein
MNRNRPLHRKVLSFVFLLRRLGEGGAFSKLQAPLRVRRSAQPNVQQRSEIEGRRWNTIQAQRNGCSICATAKPCLDYWADEHQSFLICLGPIHCRMRCSGLVVFARAKSLQAWITSTKTGEEISKRIKIKKKFENHTDTVTA